METENFKREDWQGKTKPQISFSQTIAIAAMAGAILIVVLLGLINLIF